VQYLEKFSFLHNAVFRQERGLYGLSDESNFVEKHLGLLVANSKFAQKLQNCNLSSKDAKNRTPPRESTLKTALESNLTGSSF